MVYLQTTYELCFGKRILNILNHVILPRKYRYRCIRFYVWFKDVIGMWIWLILTNISLLDRIWTLWLVRFAHSPPNVIFWLDRLIFSVSINSHPDNLYVWLSWGTYNNMLHMSMMCDHVIVTLISTHWVLVTVTRPQPTQRMSTLHGRR
jgi:hypothetical protein